MFNLGIALVYVSVVLEIYRLGRLVSQALLGSHAKLGKEPTGFLNKSNNNIIPAGGPL
jgi:hypothetical protein